MARNTVLLLEDDPTIRAAIREMLPGGKFETLEVGDSKTALNLIKREAETLRLMVLKFRMPQIPGWKILQKAQTHPKLQTIPMVLVTQASDPVQKAFSQPPQFFEIVQYPCDRAQMQGAIKMAVAKAKRDRGSVPTPKTSPPPPTARRASPPPPPPPAARKPVAPPPPPPRKAPAPPPPPAARRPTPPPPPPARQAPPAAKATPKQAAPQPTTSQKPTPKVGVPPAPKPPISTAAKAAPQPIASPPATTPTPTQQARKTFEPVTFTGGDPFAVGDRVPELPGTNTRSDDPFAAAIAAGQLSETITPPATNKVDENDPFAISVAFTPTPSPFEDPFAQDPNNPFAAFAPDPFDSEPTSIAEPDPNNPFAGEFVPDPFDSEPTVVDDQNPFAASVNFNAPSAMPPPIADHSNDSLELDPNWQDSDDDPLAGAIASLENPETLEEEDDPFSGAVTSLGEDAVVDEDDDPFAGAVMSLADDEPDEELSAPVSDVGDEVVEPPIPSAPAVVPAPVEAATVETENADFQDTAAEGWEIPYEQFECLHCNAEARDRGITGLAIDAEGRIFSCGPDLYINRWSLYELTKDLQFDLFSKGMKCLALSPDGQLLLTGAPKSNIKIWDVNSGALVDTLSDQSMGALNLVMTPDAQTVVSTAARSNVKLWDYATGDFLGPLNDESIGATVVTLTPDGQTVLTGSQQSNIRFWDWATGELLGPLNIQSLGVTALVSSPDGQAVLSGDAQGMVTITDLTTGEPIRTFKAHEEPITAIAISPDGWYIVTTSPLEMKLWGCWPEETEV